MLKKVIRFNLDDLLLYLGLEETIRRYLRCLNQ